MAPASWLVRRLRREDGTVLPLVAMMLVVILGITAFAIDLSGWYFSQRHLQMQADSAVEAGASTFFANTGSGCTANIPNVETVEANYAGVASSYGGTVASSPITSNNEKGNVSITPSVSCSAGTIDATVTNSSPPSFFSGIFGVHPTITAHARVSLEQISEEGGSGVLPYAIGQSEAVFNNQLIKIPVNAGSTLQSLVCDGNTESSTDTAASAQMANLELSGCPTTQINPGGTTCPATQLSPPSCLWEFTKVDEATGYDAGEVPRFDSGLTRGSPLLKCTSPYPVPPNYYPQYLSNGTFVSGDPRLITIFVVPNNTFTSTSHLIPVTGYAEFYVTGWDHDPCAGTLAGTTGNGIDGPKTGGGSLEGYFVSYTTPAGSTVASSGTPCIPVASEAWTYNCTYALTQ
ncbi:MAG TPA: Tad domain-containing protein [Solirubrobacteraceae bacterium]